MRAHFASWFFQKQKARDIATSGCPALLYNHCQKQFNASFQSNYTSPVETLKSSMKERRFISRICCNNCAKHTRQCVYKPQWSGRDPQLAVIKFFPGRDLIFCFLGHPTDLNLSVCLMCLKDSVNKLCLGAKDRKRPGNPIIAHTVHLHKKHNYF